MTLLDREEKRPGKKTPRDWCVEPEVGDRKGGEDREGEYRWGNENRHLVCS